MSNAIAIRKGLIEAGVKNLKVYGYPACNKDNILTDTIYSGFFLSMLKDNLGHVPEVDVEINKLIEEIGTNNAGV